MWELYFERSSLLSLNLEIITYCSGEKSIHSQIKMQARLQQLDLQVWNPAGIVLWPGPQLFFRDFEIMLQATYNKEGLNNSSSSEIRLNDQML